MAIFSLATAIIGGISSFIGTLGVFGSLVLRAAVGVGLSLLAQSLSGKPKDPTFSINGTLQGGGDVARSFIMGRTATAGSLVFVNTWPSLRRSAVLWFLLAGKARRPLTDPDRGSQGSARSHQPTGEEQCVFPQSYGSRSLPCVHA